MLVHPTLVPSVAAAGIRDARERQDRRAAMLRARRRRQRASRRVRRERIRTEAARNYMERLRAFNQGNIYIFFRAFLTE